MNQTDAKQQPTPRGDVVERLMDDARAVIRMCDDAFIACDAVLPDDSRLGDPIAAAALDAALGCANASAVIARLLQALTPQVEGGEDD